MTGGIRVHLVVERGVIKCIAIDAVNGVWLEG
jgi:hypothetical protein